MALQQPAKPYTGEQIKRIRRRHNLTQIQLSDLMRELAQEAGELIPCLGAPRVSLWEKGHVVARADVQCLLHHTFLHLQPSLATEPVE